MCWDQLSTRPVGDSSRKASVWVTSTKYFFCALPNAKNTMPPSRQSALEFSVAVKGACYPATACCSVSIDRLVYGRIAEPERRGC